MRKTMIGLGAVAVALSLSAPALADGHDGHGGHQSHDGGYGRATLTGWASLPAQTYVPGSEPSGAQLGTDPINGVTPPFPGQPVQGFSGVVRRRDGSYDVLSDNGYGNKANSGDFLLRIQRVKPDLRSGVVTAVGGVDLSDPFKRVPFPLTRADRRLTGADFDVESIVRRPDGTYWIGDEFGPWLLHFSATGALLDKPVALPGVQAPENPYLNGGTPNLGSSKGFEGMASGLDGRHLYPMLEGTVAGDPAGTLRINEFDLRDRAYTGRRWTYKLEAPGNSIGDMVSVDRDRFLIIERDNEQGDAAKLKRVYLADTRDRDKDGAVDKTQVADLLDLADPKGLGGFGPTFRFPFQTIEDVVILDDSTIALLNDNNFPFSAGRTPGRPDNDEFITVRLSRPLDADPRAYRRY
ncbi:esterase-like activity of phytase family protein [Sphaerisporangium rhizosphaerae]|uniref:Esterase-like activity of phytase family protein n=1 Tax=Sphaerisporangium rhizosphaerae TaxID=2269375 RepID=A0ABW2P4T8_9ACTN